MENSGISDFLFHIVQYCRVCVVNKENWVISLVLYRSVMMYKYYSCIGFSAINTMRMEKIFIMKYLIIYESSWKENWVIFLVLYRSVMMHKYYSCIGFSAIKHNEDGKDIHNEIFNNIRHFIKNRLHVDCI